MVPGRASRVGRAGLVLCGVSYACTVTVAVLGPSLLEPALPGGPGQPPWHLSGQPSPYLVVALSGAAILSAVAGLIFGLNALRAGWRIPARLVVAAGIIGAALLAFLPPFGSADHLSYAAYGRMAVTGHDPYTTTPAMLAKLGDPVAKAVQDWRTSPSVYGPLAVAGQALAAWIGGTSVRLIVFVLSLLNVLAFAITGLILHRLSRGDAGRQLRAALLWTANPLLLLVLVAGAHVDSQAIVFGIAGLAVAASARRRLALAGLVAGALIGLGFAIKVTTVLIGAGLAIGVLLAWQRAARQDQQGRDVRPARNLHELAPGLPVPARLLTWLAAGFIIVAVLALIPWGTGMFRPALKAGSYTSVGSPWRPVRSGLRVLIGENAAEDLVKMAAVLLAVGLLILLLRHLRDSGKQLAIAGAFAVVFAWLLAWPYVLPWYDGIGWALLALLPASRLDWLMLARTAALAIGYLPARGIPLPAGLGWLETVVRTAVTPLALAVILVLAIIWLWPGRTGGRSRLAAA